MCHQLLTMQFLSCFVTNTSLEPLVLLILSQSALKLSLLRERPIPVIPVIPTISGILLLANIPTISIVPLFALRLLDLHHLVVVQLIHPPQITLITLLHHLQMTLHELLPLLFRIRHHHPWFRPLRIELR